MNFSRILENLALKAFWFHFSLLQNSAVVSQILISLLRKSEKWKFSLFTSETSKTPSRWTPLERIGRLRDGLKRILWWHILRVSRQHCKGIWYLRSFLIFSLSNIVSICKKIWATTTTTLPKMNFDARWLLILILTRQVTTQRDNMTACLMSQTKTTF